LILPFREKNPAVNQIIGQLLASGDKRLKYNTASLLLRNRLPVADSLIQFFAALDEFRYELYTDLKAVGKESLFPKAYRSQEQLGKSRLVTLQPYGRPDTIVYLDKLPMQDRGEEGFVYFFKYKDKKEDFAWKLATAGLYPKDSSQLTYAISRDNGFEEDDDLTQLTSVKLTSEKSEKEQLEKLCKKLQYSRRKSAAEFYQESSNYSDFEFSRAR
jgi:hypothetical protein